MNDNKIMKRIKMTDDLLSQYIKSHPGSSQLHERALEIFSANGSTHSGRVVFPHGPYIVMANGCREWDVDNNEYIDYKMGHGALILGHCHPDIVQAIHDQIPKGVHYSNDNPLEIEWAMLIRKMMPSAERVEFFSCGQEANMMALRLSRVITGRKKVLRFKEHFHGWADELVVETSPGIMSEYVTVIPSNNLELVEKELATKEYAVLLTEAGGGSMGGKIPMETSFVRALGNLTKKYGTLWHMDEVVTGFRDAPGGWQSLVNVKPDLTSLGKCTAGGLGVGALIGRADIFEAFNPNTPVDRRINHSGTWNANPLTSAAGIAACKLYQNGDVQQITSEIAALFRRKANKLFREMKVNARLYSRSMAHLYLGPIDYDTEDDTTLPTKDIRNVVNPALLKIQKRLMLHLLQRGIATPGARFFCFSIAHKTEDVDFTIQALADSIETMIGEGTFTGI
ncbi:aspartate aminotransferase family protein [Chloroflexota bacterium]